MTELEKKADIEDKRRFYEDAREKMLRASQRVEKTETMLRVEREHYSKMAAMMNQRLRDLQEAAQ